MILDVEIEELNSEFDADFGEVVNISSGDKTYADGLAEGEAVGRNAAYNEFWDNFQQNGSRTNYSYAFYGKGWTDTTFKPKYDIRPTVAENMFVGSEISHLPDNIAVDFTNTTNAKSAFSTSAFVELPVIDVSSAKEVTSLFYYSTRLRKIEKIILAKDGSQLLTHMFTSSNALEEVRFEGTVGSAGLYLNYATKLSHDSIVSYINALSTTKTGLTAMLSRTAVVEAFGAVDNEEWLALVASRSNWTITLS